MVIAEPARDLAVCQCCLLHWKTLFLALWCILHYPCNALGYSLRQGWESIDTLYSKTIAQVRFAAWLLLKFLDFTSFHCIVNCHLWRVNIFLGCFGSEKRAEFLWYSMHHNVHLPVTWTNQQRASMINTHCKLCRPELSLHFPRSYTAAFNLHNFKALQAKERCIVYTSWLQHLLLCFQ